MTTATLFGIALAPLYAAIAQVESDNGKTSDNFYQIDDGLTAETSVYVKDVNRIIEIRKRQGKTPKSYPGYTMKDVKDRQKSEEMMLIYWEFYGRLYELRTGRKVTAEILARIHNGGPGGYSKTTTEKYWKKVEKQLKKQKGRKAKYDR